MSARASDRALNDGEANRLSSSVCIMDTVVELEIRNVAFINDLSLSTFAYSSLTTRTALNPTLNGKVGTWI